MFDDRSAPRPTDPEAHRDSRATPSLGSAGAGSVAGSASSSIAARPAGASGNGAAVRVGVLALQGDFREHRMALERLGTEVSDVRLPRDLDGLTGVIIPGGESTTMAKLMLDYQLDAALVAYYRAGGSLWGTCAGAITLSKDLVGYRGQPHLGLMEMRIVRNDYGRQVASFEADLAVEGLDAPFRGLFIRAPRIISVGPDVEVLARYQGDVVAAAQDRLMVTVFHPELVEDDRIHALFLGRVRQAVAEQGTGVAT